MKIISVIVPVYKVEKYLNKCIESIVNQSYRHLEIILVDDGSPDNCPKICDVWAEKDKRIKVIHKCNEGLSSARLTGIQVATGEYVQFVDSDDYLEQGACELLINDLINNNADLCVANIKYINFNLKQPRLKSFITTRQDFAIETLYSQGLFNFAWNKLFKRSLLPHEPIIVEKYGEDFWFNCEYLKNCKKIVYNETPIYNYVAIPNSIVHCYSPDCFPNHCKVIDFIQNILMLRYPNLVDFFNYLKSEFLLASFKGIITTNLFTRKQKLKIVKNYMQSVYFVQNVKYAKGLKRKVQLFCLKFHLINTLKWIYKIKH